MLRRDLLIGAVLLLATHTVSGEEAKKPTEAQVRALAAAMLADYDGTPLPPKALDGGPPPPPAANNGRLCSNVCPGNAACETQCFDDNSGARTTCKVWTGGNCCSPWWHITYSVERAPVQYNERTERQSDGSFICHRETAYDEDREDSNGCCANPPCVQRHCTPREKPNSPFDGSCDGSDQEGPPMPNCNQSWN